MTVARAGIDGVCVGYYKPAKRVVRAQRWQAATRGAKHGALGRGICGVCGREVALIVNTNKVGFHREVGATPRQYSAGPRRETNARDALVSIRAMHAKSTGEGGLTSGFCCECDHLWPCPTFHVASGWGDWEDCVEAGWCSHVQDILK